MNTPVLVDPTILQAVIKFAEDRAYGHVTEADAAGVIPEPQPSAKTWQEFYTAFPGESGYGIYLDVFQSIYSKIVNATQLHY